ncbi:2-polyprenyl-6-methoxyphenol hydroxylase [Amycolatopsis marina]|uniref:2-polyprenyl-6-methoxyphenol hydroxylase n=1 Tax=Amycolatopsis marina TaxID=490629 RepID=A0A1I1ATA0_9PSEU|nr:FAD-dependent monooxygenase [Amycolatopsis marina]SFB41261.1 2-polyprenyl-6-methoxyphenol hydroxylase [Amycolatopsis marina]
MRIVICGAGIAGLTLAIRVAELGGDVVLLERATGPRQQGYMIDFFGPGFDAAEAMGLLPALDNVAFHLDQATLIDERGRHRADIRPRQFADGPLLNIMRPDLEQVLRERLPAEVDLRFGTGPSAVEDRGDGVRVTLEDGAELEADLLVGADGIHSTVRGLVFGPESLFLRYLGFHTAAFTFDSPGIHGAVRGRACMTDSIDRQMGFYALRDGAVAAFAVYRNPDPELPADASAAVRDAFGGLGWVVPEAIEKRPASAEIYYDQVAQIHLPKWSKGRVALVGDAAYAVSLLAGQGASLGIAGAFVLADRLAKAPTIPEALAEYEQVWRPVAEEKQRTGRGAARWFLPASTPQLWLRRAVLRMARLPVINRIVATTLAGRSISLIKDLTSADPAALAR